MAKRAKINRSTEIGREALDPVARKIIKQGKMDHLRPAAINKLLETEPEQVQFAIDKLAMWPRERVVFELVKQHKVSIYIARSIVDTAIQMVGVLGPDFHEYLIRSFAASYAKTLEQIDKALAACDEDDHYNIQRYLRLRNETTKTMMSILPQTHIVHSQSENTYTLKTEEIRNALISTYGGPVYDVESNDSDGDSSSDS